MDIKMIKELCEEHEALTKTNEELGKLIDNSQDNYTKFQAVYNGQDMNEGKIPSYCNNPNPIYLSKKCITESISINVRRMNEIENELGSIEEDDIECSNSNTKMVPIIFVTGSSNLLEVLNKPWIGNIEAMKLENTEK